MTADDILDRARERLEDASHIAGQIAAMTPEEQERCAVTDYYQLWRFLADCAGWVRREEAALSNCTDCGEPADNGEGYDGRCGNCADTQP